MALINCPECNKQISDTALKCIGCGTPVINIEWDETEALPNTDRGENGFGSTGLKKK